MRRDEFEHVLRAAADLSGHGEFVVIGSQAIHGSLDDPPAELLESMEVDLYPLRAPEEGDRIDASIGDGSQFQAAFGYFAHSVGPETAKAPAGWHDRLVRIEVEPRAGAQRKAVALCLERHDLVLAKVARGDLRDWEYAQVAVRSGIVEAATLLERVDSMPLPAAQRRHIARQLQALRSSSAE